MGRTKKSVKEALSMLIECGMTSMNAYDYDEEENFTLEDAEKAYLWVLKKMGFD